MDLSICQRWIFVHFIQGNEEGNRFYRPTQLYAHLRKLNLYSLFPPMRQAVKCQLPSRNVKQPIAICIASRDFSFLTAALSKGDWGTRLGSKYLSQEEQKKRKLKNSPLQQQLCYTVVITYVHGRVWIAIHVKWLRWPLRDLEKTKCAN
jgi:hypothetical protein